ncbi:hypothetical protein B0H14DRAFT_3610774 [Mycena olivaceomarginata]|nr:hypothetical protein B0H14DRAFT_3610774 [Mycena olivaceomarginata]
MSSPVLATRPFRPHLPVPTHPIGPRRLHLFCADANTHLVADATCRAALQIASIPTSSTTVVPSQTGETARPQSYCLLFCTAASANSIFVSGIWVRFSSTLFLLFSSLSSSVFLACGSPSYRHAPATSLCSAATRTSTSVACAIRGDYQRHRLTQGTVYSTTTPRAISHATMNPLHAARNVFVGPYAAFVASPRCATVLTSATALTGQRSRLPHPSVLPATRSASAARATHLRELLSTAHAAFVALPRVLAILSAVPTLRSNSTPGTHHKHDADDLHVACPCAVTIFSGASPSASAQSQVPSRGASMTCTTTSARSTRCNFSPSPAPFLSRPHVRAHHLQGRSALTARLPCLHVPRYSPQHPLRAQRAPRTFPTIRAAPIASDHRADPFRPTPAPPVCSTKTTAAPARGPACADAVNPPPTTRLRTVHGRTETTRSCHSNSSYTVRRNQDPAVLISERAAAPAAFQEHRHTANARGREGEGSLIAALLLYVTLYSGCLPLVRTITVKYFSFK